MKKIFTFISLCMIAFNAIHAEITWTLSDDGTLTISGTDMPNYNWSESPWYSQKEKIRKIIIENGVTNIAENAFNDCSVLTTVTIPNSITSIGERAFYDCSSLTSVTIPNSVTSIGECAFDGCSHLFSITFSNSLMSIEKQAFYRCSSLATVTIPNSVTNIGAYAFSDCSSLTFVTIPNSVKGIGVYAFYGCTSLTSVTIPNSVTSIGNYAFSYCPNLTSIKVEKNNSFYDSRNNCNAIIEKKTNILIAGCKNTIIPNSVTSIGNYAFYDCISLTSITIPTSVTSIGKYAFYDCPNITSITIPNSVTSIGKNAFYGCIGLTSITIPNSVTSIGNYAFSYCSNLCSINVEKGNTYYDSRDNCNAIIEKKTKTLIAGCKNTIVPNTITSIGNQAFFYCTSLNSIIIANSITSIGNFAFGDCTNLTSITCKANTPPNCEDASFYEIDKSIPVYVPNNSIDTYKAAYVWKDFTNIQAIIEPVNISFTNVNENLIIGKTKKLEASITPDNAMDKTLTWTSSNTEVATVSSEGIVTAKNKGTTIITATTYNGKIAKCAITVEQPVTAIALSATTASLWVGKTKTLTATISPTTANNTTVNWSSSNNNVATVSSKGVITAKGKGTCTITCTAADRYGTKSTCEVTVKQQVTEIALSETIASLWVGETKTIKATATPTTANNTNVSWSSSNKNVATVSSKGVITAKGKGTCTITCTAADGYGTKTTCEITVKQQVTEIALSETTVSLWVGDTKALTATATPTTANNTNVTWSSSDDKVASVSSEGVITTNGEGTCTITCTAADGHGTSSNCEVIVMQKETSIEEIQIVNEDSPIYSLNGQRINKSNAQKGIYIKNGKKYAK